MNVKQPDRVYHDPNGTPLVYSQPRGSDRWAITVNTRVKWYRLYLVDWRTHEVRELPQFLYDRFFEQHPDLCAMPDHVPSPEFCKWLEEQEDLTWDETAFDLVVGRFVRERLDIDKHRETVRAFGGCD